MSVHRSPWLIPRLLVYVGIQMGLLAVYVWAVVKSGQGRMGDLDLESLLREDQLLEWIELGIVGLAILIGVGSFRSGQPVLHRVLVLLLAVPLFRELDDTLEDLLAEDAHHLFMGVAMFGVIVTAALGRAHLPAQVMAFLGRPGFYLMLFGVLLVVVYAQILGQREVWKLLADDNLTSEAKRFIEEGLEFMGYVAILTGMIEERFFGFGHSPEVNGETASDETG